MSKRILQICVLSLAALHVTCLSGNYAENLPIRKQTRAVGISHCGLSSDPHARLLRLKGGALPSSEVMLVTAMGGALGAFTRAMIQV